MSGNGILVIDKPAGPTSHAVVAQVRRLIGAGGSVPRPRVGHAGTLDPMATGVLVVGVGPATRLLGYLGGHDKDYTATIRLGVTTDTDDADGRVLVRADPARVAALTDDAVAAAMAGLTGEIDQSPPAVSAVKVAGVRAYARARSGETVMLRPRRVRVERFELRSRHRDTLEVEVTCSAGFYVRSLARDLGASLGVGAHLVALRRTRSGIFDLSQAVPLTALDPTAHLLPAARVAAMAFPSVRIPADEAERVRHGQRRVLAGMPDAGPVAVLDPAGALVALVSPDPGGVARPLAVFPDR